MNIAESREPVGGIAKGGTIPEMRLCLAVKGYRQLLDILTRASEGKTGGDALKANPWLPAVMRKKSSDCQRRPSEVR